MLSQGYRQGCYLSNVNIMTISNKMVNLDDKVSLACYVCN